MSFWDVTTKRILKKLGGDKIPGKVYTFDGDTTGKTVIDNLVKISDDAPDFKNVTKIVGTTNDGMVVEILLDSLAFNEYDSGVQEITDGSDQLLAVSSHVGDDEAPAGLYVLNAPHVYISRIEFAETIVPIDPKYLPGVCLPVVEITSTEIPISGMVEINADEKLQLETAIATGQPAVIKAALTGTPISAIGQMLDTAYFFTIPTFTESFAIGIQEGTAFIGVVE